MASIVMSCLSGKYCHTTNSCTTTVAAKNAAA